MHSKSFTLSSENACNILKNGGLLSSRGKIVLVMVAICSSYVLYQYFHSLRNSDAKCVGNKMPRRFQNFSVCLGNTSEKKTAKNSTEIFVYYVDNGFHISRFLVKGYDLVF